MTNTSLTVNNLLATSECRCSGNCPECSGHNQTNVLPIKQTLTKVTDEVKAQVNTLKTDARNEKFQKGILVASAVVLLYIILK